MYRISWLVVSGRTVSSAARPYDGAMSTRIPAPHRDSDGDSQWPERVMDAYGHNAGEHAGSGASN